VKQFSVLVAVFFFAVALLAGCNTGTQTPKAKTYDVHGKVVSVDVKKKEVTLDHEAVPGLMHAMKMPFAVESAKVLEGIKAGDQVHGKLRVKDGEQTITELMKH
jgi:protein SCO1